MDALGILSSISSLSALIPNFKFVGVFFCSRSTTHIASSWKFGIATVSYYGAWYSPNQAEFHPVETLLVAPGAMFNPCGAEASGSNIRFDSSNGISASDHAQVTALIFTY